MRNSLLVLFTFATILSAKEDKAAAALRELDNLKREVAALESIRTEKLDSLEQKESIRWETRYKATAKAKEAEDQARIMEEAFGRLAADASRLEEDLVKARNDADEKKEVLSAAKDAHNAFVAQVKRRVDEAASSVSSDFPVGIDTRPLAYSQSYQALSAKEPDVNGAIDLFLHAHLDRFDLTLTQSLETRQTVFEDGHAASAWRLRLGTVFTGELEKEGTGASQILLRTGSLQGRTFTWRQNLARDYNTRLRDAVLAAAGGKEHAVLPMDVLQFKSAGSGFVRGGEQSINKRFIVWFKAGGIVLYPLFAVGLLALLMILERLYFFARRATDSRNSAACDFSSDSAWVICASSCLA